MLLFLLRNLNNKMVEVIKQMTSKCTAANFSFVSSYTFFERDQNYFIVY